jgi:transcriptional antiterminator RfaH
MWRYMRVDYTMMSEMSWAVVNAQSNRESVAIDNLVRQEFDAYCPMVRRRVKHARRVQDVLRPLFPGYLFVRLTSRAQSWRPAISTLGVRTLVRFGEQLAFIGDDFIRELKSREINGEIVQPEKPYMVGQKVEVAGGSLGGLVGTIIKMDEKDRLIVLMNLLSRPVKVQLAAKMVVPA